MFSLVLFLTGSVFASEKIINDELVRGLSCAKLSPDAIYRSIREEAMYYNRQYPISNFSSFSMGGHCWAIARFERIAILLGRLKSSLPPAKTSKVAEMARVVGYTKIPYTPVEVKNFKRVQLEVFQWPRVGEEWWGKFVAEANLPKAEDELELAQRHLFYRAKNLAYVFKTYSVAEKRKALAAILQLINGKRLPLINLRKTRTDQHVVVGASVERINAGEFKINIIDSNSGFSIVHIKTDANSFSAFYLSSAGDPIPLDYVTVVEEEERPALDAALVSHYQKLCR